MLNMQMRLGFSRGGFQFQFVACVCSRREPKVLSSGSHSLILRYTLNHLLFMCVNNLKRAVHMFMCTECIEFV